MTNSQKINLIALHIDNIDQLLTELKPEYKQGMKQLCNNALKHTNKLVKEFDKIHSLDNQEAFGNSSDELRELIENWVIQKNSKNNY